jgi:hypothetical protein
MTLKNIALENAWRIIICDNNYVKQNAFNDPPVSGFQMNMPFFIDEPAFVINLNQF